MKAITSCACANLLRGMRQSFRGFRPFPLTVSMLFLVGNDGCTTQQQFSEELERIHSLGKPQMPLNLEQVIWA